MVKYPIKINVKIYRGLDKIKMIECGEKIEIAGKIEKYLNKKMEKCKKGKSEIFNYPNIANDLNLDKKIVENMLFQIDGGSNGITIER